MAWYIEQLEMAKLVYMHTFVATRGWSMVCPATHHKTAWKLTIARARTEPSQTTTVVQKRAQV